MRSTYMVVTVRGALERRALVNLIASCYPEVEIGSPWNSEEVEAFRRLTTVVALALIRHVSVVTRSRPTFRRLDSFRTEIGLQHPGEFTSVHTQANILSILLVTPRRCYLL